MGASLKSKYSILYNRIKREFYEADMSYRGEAVFFDNHIDIVIKIAKKLAKKYSADTKFIEFAALVHDIGLINSDEDHAIRGSRIVKDYIKDTLPNNQIEEISRIILIHTLEHGMPVSLNEKIILTADALAHFISPWFFIKAQQLGNISKFKNWLDNKLKKDIKRIFFDDELILAKKFYEVYSSAVLDYKSKIENLK